MWKNFNINKNQIITSTAKSVLIAMPHKSKYDGFRFWHPAKLVREGKHSGSVSISFTDEFTFNLKKYGNGRYNKTEVIDEITISAEEFELAFGTTDKNISAPID